MNKARKPCLVHGNFLRIRRDITDAGAVVAEAANGYAEMHDDACDDDSNDGDSNDGGKAKVVLVVEAADPVA